MEFIYFIAVPVLFFGVPILSHLLSRKRRLRRIEQYQFPDSLVTRLANQYPNYNAVQIKKILNTLKDYFKICLLANGGMVAMPSKIVDEAWHEFILFTREYHLFCQKAFGRYFHHTPFDGLVKPEKVREAVQLTRQLSLQLYDIKPDNITHPSLPLALTLFTIDSELGVTGGHHYNMEMLMSPAWLETGAIDMGISLDVGGDCGGDGGDGDGGCGGD